MEYRIKRNYLHPNQRLAVKWLKVPYAKYSLVPGEQLLWVLPLGQGSHCPDSPGVHKLSMAEAKGEAAGRELCFGPSSSCLKSVHYRNEVWGVYCVGVFSLYKPQRDAISCWPGSHCPQLESSRQRTLYGTHSIQLCLNFQFIFVQLVS